MSAPVKRLLDAHDLQGPEYGLSRIAAYRLLGEIGVKVSPRRVVVLRDRLEAHLAGEDGRLNERPPSD